MNEGEKTRKINFLFCVWGGGEKSVFSEVKKKKSIRYKYKNIFFYFFSFFLVNSKSVEKTFIRKAKK